MNPALEIQITKTPLIPTSTPQTNKIQAPRSKILSQAAQIRAAAAIKRKKISMTQQRRREKTNRTKRERGTTMVEFEKASYRFQRQPKKWIRDRPRQLQADLVACVFPEDAETLDSIGRNRLRESTWSSSWIRVLITYIKIPVAAISAGSHVSSRVENECG